MDTDGKKLFLLDAYALIYRAYYAMIRSPRVTTDGLNTSAIFGFCMTLEDLLKKENPDYLAVCFDPAKGKTFRHDVYPEYKAQRQKQPEDITAAVPYIKKLLEAYCIPVVEIPGYEADDVIGTLSRRAEAEGYTTYMMTPDKDYGQLVTDSVLMYRPALGGHGFEIRTPQVICERYGIQNPMQVIDLLALEGDASDNIPGCPGIGEKTAAKLIAEYGSVENLIDRVDELKGALHKKISENIEQIKFSKYLVTIKTDVPVDIEISDLRRCTPDIPALRVLFERLEFKTMLSRYASVEVVPTAPTPATIARQASLFDEIEESVAAETQTVEVAFSDVKILESDNDIRNFVAEAVNSESIGLSLDAFGEDAMTAQFEG